MMNKTLSYNNIALQYKLSGSGNCVVLLHGFGEDSSVWDGMVQPLAASYHVLVPSVPGSGRSELLEGENISMTDYADAVHAILKAEGIIKCSIIGHSMGGYIALAFAEKYPDMLHAFGLFHSSAYADDEAKKETRTKAIAFIESNGVAEFFKSSTPGLFKDASASSSAVNDLLEKGNQFEPAALVQYYKAMIARPDRTEVLKNFPRPVLFLLGEHDKAVPFEHGLEQSHLPQQSHLHILRNSAHMGMLEEPEKSLLNVTDFLRRVYA
ncbi:MAG: alpha/beta hydrolase [Sphingobacteriales bacterium]|nr:MAG: alpha/beta hydrolase [Sphingobacteriales bacterium]